MYEESQSPQLRAILYMEGELHTRPRLVCRTELCHVREGEIEAALTARGLSAKECLMLAATDSAIRIAKRYNMAVAGYVNPALPGQLYYGVEMLIEGFEEVDDAFLLRIFQRHHSIPWTIARTERFWLREFAMEDLEALIALYETPGLAWREGADGKRLPGYVEPLYPIEEEREYQKNYIRCMYRYFGYGMWLVIEEAGGRLIGRVGLENREYPEGVEVELGYLIHPQWQRQGFGTEVCTEVIAYARSVLQCGRINLLTEEGNAASIALAEKLGFVYVGDTSVSGSLTRRYRLLL